MMSSQRSGADGAGLKDFSQQAVKRAVLGFGLTHWLTLYPPAVGIPLGFVAFLFDLPLLYLGTVGLVGLGLTSAVVNIFFRGDRLAEEYIRKMSLEIKEREKQVIASLQKDLRGCLAIPATNGYADQGLEQFAKIQQKYANVHQLLGRKLQQGELTFGRFLGVAEQVYLSSLDNLRQVVAIMQSISSLDPRYIEKRLKQLRSLAELSEADRLEVKTLMKRRKLREEQLQQINLLLSQNEEAMTKLEEATAAIALMRTDGTFASSDLETSISQLQEMAERAHVYN